MSVLDFRLTFGLQTKCFVKHDQHHMKLRLFILLLITSPLLSLAQKRITAIDIKDVASVYVDRPGDLYILHTDNTISKFDTLGMAVASPKFETTPTVFEPRDGARMFIYSAETKKGSFFSSATNQEFIIHDYYALEPILATSAGDNGIWIVDKADWSIKRIDLKTSKVIAEALINRTQFEGDPKIIAVREYQNFFFVLEKNTGILIFNGLGKQIKKIDAPKITYFNFLGEELYYIKDDKMIFYDLFDGTTREEGADKKALYTLLTDARKYVVYTDRIDVFYNYR